MPRFRSFLRNEGCRNGSYLRVSNKWFKENGDKITLPLKLKILRTALSRFYEPVTSCSWFSSFLSPHSNEGRLSFSTPLAFSFFLFSSFCLVSA
jgi:hypothetical protein